MTVRKVIGWLMRIAPFAGFVWLVANEFGSMPFRVIGLAVVIIHFVIVWLIFSNWLIDG